jgi:hypothetical protein
MPGIPADLDFSFLRGVEVIQVCLGVWQVLLQSRQFLSHHTSPA